MALAEECLTGLDHRDSVAGTRHEVDVPLAGDVEGVAALAPERALSLRQPARAHRAAKEIDGLGEHRGILAPMKVIRNDELPHSDNSFAFQGADHDGVGVSFFLVNAAPGRGPSLHTHDYPEVFIMLEGQATFRGLDEQVEVSAGDVVVVPAGEPHGFNASGDGSRQVNIHVNPRFVTKWLEEESYG
jgi:quercetin dioxygenase-like cupin family protein